MARRFEDEYELGDLLGTGNCSHVSVAIHRKTNMKYAAKIIDKTSLSDKLRDKLRTEIDILSKIHHPLIIPLIDVFDTPYKLWIVLELKEGGDLFDRISNKEFSEPVAAYVLQQIGYGVQYLHNTVGIVHRDLKPENILFANHREDSPLCIADFGFAKEISGNEMISTPCGTIPYLAPEVANSELYTKGVDMWAIGVIMYTMLCGYPPFYHEDDDELMKLVAQGAYHFHSDPWDNISDEAKRLIKNLLQIDTKKRYTTEQFLRDPWIVNNQKKTVETPKSRGRNDLMTVSSENLKKFLNHAIEAQREEDNSVTLKSASESALWKRRQHKSQTTLTKSQ